MIDPIELHAYADGQLDQADRERIARQLESDFESKMELDSILSLKKLVSGNCHAVECRDEWKKCVGRLNELDKSKRAESFVGRYAWALCGIFFMAILIGGVVSRNSPSAGGQSTDIARVVASMSPTGGPVSKEPAKLRKWLDSLVGQAAASVSPERLNIVSASTGELDGARAARIILQDRSGEMALLLVNSDLNLGELTPTSTSAFRAGQLQGSNFIAWHNTGNTYVLVGNRSYDDLVKVASDKLVR